MAAAILKEESKQKNKEGKWECGSSGSQG